MIYVVFISGFFLFIYWKLEMSFFFFFLSIFHDID